VFLRLVEKPLWSTPPFAEEQREPFSGEVLSRRNRVGVVLRGIHSAEKSRSSPTQSSASPGMLYGVGYKSLSAMSWVPT
jgi:hypothetical protein